MHRVSCAPSAASLLSTRFPTRTPRVRRWRAPSRALGIAFIAGIIIFVVGMQVGYGVMRRLNTANLSDTVTTETVSRALEGGVEWGNGFTQFPADFTVG